MLDVRKSSAPLGAEVHGLDLSKQIDDGTFEEIKAAFAQHSVLVFKNQNITPRQHIDFSRRFGELEILKFYQKYLHKEHPEIFIVSNVIENGEPVGLQEAGRIWHTDVSYKKNPSMGSLLYAKEVPHDDAGEPLGDTLFTSTTAAYDALADELKARIEGRTAVHKLDEKRYQQDQDTKQGRGTRAALTDEQKKMIEDVVHPVVRTHSSSGRKSLYVNKLYTFRINGMAEAESSTLLKELYEHITDPRFIYRHRWSVGDLLMWDNGATQHIAIGDYGPSQRRLMYRTTVAGEVPR